MTSLRAKLDRLAILVVISGMIAHLAHAIPVHVLDLDKLTNDSTLIVVGELVSTREISTGTPLETNGSTVRVRTQDGALLISRILKDTGLGVKTSATITFRFYEPEIFIGWPTPRVRTFAIFFLKTDASGVLRFTDPVYPFSPALKPAPPAGNSPIDRVVNETSSFIYAPGVPINDKTSALNYLARSRSSASTAVLKASLNYDNQELRYVAAGKLLERNDISGLPLAKAVLLRALGANSDILVNNLSSAISIGVKDPKAIPDLGDLLSSPSPEARRAAALALRRTGAQEAVSPLLSALSDPDREVRYYSVIGLAEITGQLAWRPSMDDFARDQARFLNHWRQWGRDTVTPQ